MTAQQPLPIQPVERPILCGPYAEPTEYWLYDPSTGAATRAPGRRPAGYWYKTERVGSNQLSMFAEEHRDDLPIVNALRADVKRWRESGYERATRVTKELLAHWWREDRPRRLFFCQLEAVETVIFLAEVWGDGKGPRFNGAFTAADIAELRDLPDQSGFPALTRYGCKMATGSGKTVVMAMLIAWSVCNRGQVASDERFPSSVLVCCPNLTVKERLRVLRPEDADNYYAAFDLVPVKYRPLLAQGRVRVMNWHGFAPESPHAEGGKTYAVVDKGPESNDAFARRVLGDLFGHDSIMVLNDEGHHAYRPAPPQSKQEQSEAKAAAADNDEATVWIAGVDRINAAAGAGVRLCVDLSATPFYIAGSGHPEGRPFPWLVSDFGLVDAIESGIVKIPRLPVSDTTGRPEPKYFRLWKNVVDNLQPGEFLPGKARKPKPDAVWREAEPALRTLASQWRERFGYVQEATPGQEQVPPVLIIVCDNTDIAELFFRKISGEEVVPVLDATAVEDADDAGGGEDADDAPEPAAPTASGRSKKPKTRISYGHGTLFPEVFANAPGVRRTLRIDSKLLAEAESEKPGENRQQAAEELRRIVATVGRPGEPGEQIRCVVSVGMLTEGWDANNVTHILGLRAFGSQLLSEQVVGRGLRRIDYTVDPQTGLLTEEYVDVYGIPFSVIPYKGRETTKPQPIDKPKQHVRALPERSDYEIRFPVVEGYAFALERNVIRADIAAMEPLQLEPDQEPTAVFVQPTVGHKTGAPGGGPGGYEEQTRDAYYRSVHPQQIAFEIALHVTDALLSGEGRSSPLLQSRHQLFPQVLRLTLDYIARKVDLRGENPREIGHERYARRIVERLVTAIEPDAASGEPPLLPIINRYQPWGTTADVDFKTVQICFPTHRSHVNQVTADTKSWEQSAAFRLEQAVATVEFYVRNEGLGFSIPYEFQGISHGYEPDFLVRLTDRSTLILEIKGWEDEEDRAKHEAAKRWARAVNIWGRAGRWNFHVCKDPQLLGRELDYLVARSRAAAD